VSTTTKFVDDVMSAITEVGGTIPEDAVNDLRKHLALLLRFNKLRMTLDNSTNACSETRGPGYGA
jgi:hypothetical protein